MTRRDSAFDPVALLAALVACKVDFVVIGGIAVQAHGHTRTTQDVDIFPAPGRENWARLRRAAERLGASLPVRETEVVTLDTEAGGLDIHRSPSGSAGYDAVRARALVLELAGLTIPVASLDDLIAMKRASGRPIDRSDVISLTDPGPTNP